jgi:pSer/pThr/pTyr-binding forkhead associated (FHA) protein
MAKLILKFEAAVLKEIPVGARPISIGRSPDNDLQIDNLAVSTHHARIYMEYDRLVVEDLNSLNGTFVNNQRVQKKVLEENDQILIGKHTIVVRSAKEMPLSSATIAVQPKVAVPKVEETVMMDSKRRRELLAQGTAGASAAAAPAAAPPQLKVATLVALRGKTDQKEYPLVSKLTVIGTSDMATVKLTGLFARLFGPDVAAQINKRADGYYVGKAGKVPKVNGQPIHSPTKLNDGDTLEIAGVTFNFLYRD